VREESPSPLQWYRVVQEDQALAAGFIWKPIAVDTAFQCSKQNQWATLRAFNSGFDLV
jgi:hypothetical protein